MHEHGIEHAARVGVESERNIADTEDGFDLGQFLQRPLRWLEAISRFRGTISGAPNFAFDLCARKVTPEQRQAWREVVNLVPILPAGLESPPIPKPSVPRRAAPAAPTNGN